MNNKQNTIDQSKQTKPTKAQAKKIKRALLEAMRKEALRKTKAKKPTLPADPYRLIHIINRIHQELERLGIDLNEYMRDLNLLWKHHERDHEAGPQGTHRRIGLNKDESLIICVEDDTLVIRTMFYWIPTRS